MHILVLSSYFPPDISATGDQTWAACRRFVERGDTVTVVCTFPHYAKRALDPAYRRRLFEVGSHDGMRVVRVPLYVGSFQSKLHRSGNYLSLTATMALGALVQSRPDVILANSPPVTIGGIGIALGRLWGVPCVYHVGDVWSAAIDTLAGGFFGPLRRAVKAAERFVFANADAVTTVSEEIRGTVIQLGARPERVVAVPSAADTRHITPRPRDNPVARRLGLVDTFNVLFSGNIGLSQGLEYAVLAAGRLADELPDLRLLVVGSGATRPALEALVAEKGLRNVLLRDFVPRDELPDLLATADVGLVPLKAGIATHSTPSKVFTLMAAARPILASVEEPSETARTVREAGAGVVIPPVDVEAYVAALRALHADPAGRAAMGRAGRALVEARFTDTLMGDRFREVLARVVGEGA